VTIFDSIASKDTILCQEGNGSIQVASLTSPIIEGFGIFQLNNENYPKDSIINSQLWEPDEYVFTYELSGCSDTFKVIIFE